MKVEIYYNLHKHLWSVRSAKTKRVIQHVEELYLTPTAFRVQEAGRQKTCSSRRKNVHAYIQGVLMQNTEIPDHSPVQVYYNPYTTAQFMVGTQNARDLNLNLLHFTKNRKVLAY